MSLIKMVLGVVTLIMSGLVQFLAASISLPVIFASSGNPGLFLMGVMLFASANILVAAAIALIYSRFDNDSRLAAVLYIIASVPLLMSGKNAIAIGILALFFALILFINYFAITKQH